MTPPWKPGALDARQVDAALRALFEGPDGIGPADAGAAGLAAYDEALAIVDELLDGDRRPVVSGADEVAHRIVLKRETWDQLVAAAALGDTVKVTPAELAALAIERGVDTFLRKGLGRRR